MGQPEELYGVGGMACSSSGQQLPGMVCLGSMVLMPAHPHLRGTPDPNTVLSSLTRPSSLRQVITVSGHAQAQMDQCQFPGQAAWSRSCLLPALGCTGHAPKGTEPSPSESPSRSPAQDTAVVMGPSTCDLWPLVPPTALLLRSLPGRRGSQWGEAGCHQAGSAAAG